MEGRTLTSAPADTQVADLYGRYHAQIERYCRARLRNREEAEDAVQNTFIRVTTALRKGIRPELEAPWLYKIAHNVCLSRVAQRKEAAAELSSVEDRLPAPDLTRPDRLIGLEDALAEMPENLRRVILLREWQGLSYAEIAEETGQSQSAVETLIFRARRHLAKALGAVNFPLWRLWPLKFAAGTAVVAGLAGGGLMVAQQTSAQPVVVPARPAAATRVAATPVAYVRPAVVQTHRVVPAARPVRSPAPQSLRPAVSETRSMRVAKAPAAPAPQAQTAAAPSTPVPPRPVMTTTTAAPATAAPEPTTTQADPTTTVAQTTTAALDTVPVEAPAVSVPSVDPPALPAVPDVTVPTVTAPAVPTLP